jgi:uncharacterized phage infection (PIP) family protein YhgE
MPVAAAKKPVRGSQAGKNSGRERASAAGPRRPGATTTRAASAVKEARMDSKQAADANGERNVDQIRDILFGGQMRDYERRFHELSQRLESDAKALHADFEKRCLAIEKRLDEQVERLAKQLRQESNDRGSGIDDLESRLQQAARVARNETQSGFATLAQDLKSTDERLRSALADLQDALRQTQQRGDSALGAARDELRGEKVGREDLAALLSEVALRLKGHFDLPGAG